MPEKEEGFMTELPTVPEGEFAVFGTVHAHPEHADALEAFYAESTRIAQTEPGVVFYTIGRDPDDRNLFHFFERYTGRVAFEAHVALPMMKKLFDEYKYIKGVEAKFVTPILPATPGNKYDLTEA